MQSFELPFSLWTRNKKTKPIKPPKPRASEGARGSYPLAATIKRAPYILQID